MMISRPFLIACLIVIVFGCHEETDILVPDPLSPNQTTFRSSLFIQARDNEGNFVEDALIRIGNVQGLTDTKGFLFLNNIELAESSYLVAEKEGYFHASRRFYPSPGQSHFINLILLSNARDAFFTSSTGKSLNFEDGVTLNFPSDAYELKNGSPYNGVVLVSEQMISADDPDLSIQMPGDLTGINNDGDLGSLTSMGMVAVELRSSSGELLQLKEGFEVEMKIKVPQNLLSYAPATLPMWYFDEISGIWREEGFASLSGDLYTTKVHHFSFWNCDDWFPTIKWNASFLFEDGTPAIQIKVDLTILSLNTSSFAYTNEYGKVSGMVAADQEMLLSIKDRCNNEVFSIIIGPYSDSITIDPIIIDPPSSIKINGVAVDCEKNPVSDGYAVMDFGVDIYYVPLHGESGNFHSTILWCDQDGMELIVVDNENLRTSLSQTFHYYPILDVDTILVCQDLNEYCKVRVEGFSNSFLIFPIIFENLESNLSAISNIDSIGNDIYLAFESTSTGYYPVKDCFLRIKLGIESYGVAYMGNLDITHFGEIGDYVQGTLTGYLNYDPGSGFPGLPYTVKFSVLRK